MKARNSRGRRGRPALPVFDAGTFFRSLPVAKTIQKYRRDECVFAQGDACEHVLYIQNGGVKLSVLSKAGKEAVVAILGPGDFFGEGCLAGQAVRMGSATAITATVILKIARQKMVQLLHEHHGMSDRFIAHMLARNIRIEEDLIDQLFNSSEKRLARAPRPETLAGDARGDDRHDAIAREFFPEQVQEAGVHRLRR